MSNVVRNKNIAMDSQDKAEVAQIGRKVAVKACPATVKADDEKINILTAKEVVILIFKSKISYRRLLDLAKMGDIPCFRSGHVYLFSESEVNKWLQKKLTSPAWMKSSRR